jgi:hypothetical protein
VRAIETRLSRLESLARATQRADSQAAHHRQSLRATLKMYNVIRERLQAMGIDPEAAVSLRRGERILAELAAIPDTPELHAADEAIVHADDGNGGDGARQFQAEIEKMADRCRANGYRLDLANASPAELLAYCVAVEIEAWGPSCRSAGSGPIGASR